MRSVLKLSDDDLLFMRYCCDLFPTFESPLRAIAGQPLDEADLEATFTSLEERGLLNPGKSGASQAVLDRVESVSECDARVVMRFSDAVQEGARSFYLFSGIAVEYRHQNGMHHFGEPRGESALAAELAQSFVTKGDTHSYRLELSASDYLVFAVFARDVRSKPAPTKTDPASDDDAPMSVDEVLAYFDEPETQYVRTPSDDSWQQSLESLSAQGVLVEKSTGWELHPSLHALAREIVADHQRTVVRYDFLDEQWLVREVNLYPSADTVHRVGTDPEGAVLIQELSSVTLADVLAGVVTTLPSLLNPEVPAVLKEFTPAEP